MHPAAVVRAAAEASLDGLVVCDHNAADNVPAVLRAARAAGLGAVPGMELTSEEEVHVVALLPDARAAEALQARVSAVLPPRPPGEAVFGEQVIADEQAEVLGFNPLLLAGATTWSLEHAVDEIHQVGGLAVAAHADRERFGVIGQLGFVPEGLALDAVEISALMPYDLGRAKFGQALRLPVLTGSDAHEPRAVGRAVTFLHLERPEPQNVIAALRGERGHSVLGGGRPMEDLALHVLDVARNSLDAGATKIVIDVTERADIDLLAIRVADNGRGMDDAAAARATDPFYTTRTTRRVGLGLALLRHAAEAAGGGLEVRSVVGEGTEVHARFSLGHLDRAPLGDLETTVLVLAASSPGLHLEFTHRRGVREYTLSTADIEEALGGARASSPEGLALVREVVRRGEADLAAAPRRSGPPQT
jgi:signal transduction histidine kinase